MNETDRSKRTMTFDEALELIVDVARNGDGVQKLRALKMIREEQASTVTLPGPLTVSEQIDRLSRLNLACGKRVVQLAYRKAWPKSKKDVFEQKPKLEDGDIGDYPDDELPTSLRRLYRQFPETKRAGCPPGYPQRGSLEQKVGWVRQAARDILRGREQKHLDNLSDDAARKADVQT